MKRKWSELNVVIYGPFMNACKYGKLDVIINRFDRVSDYLKYRGLYVASKNGHTDLLEYISTFIDPRERINGLNGSAIAAALCWGQTDSIDFFIRENYIGPNEAFILLMESTHEDELLNVEMVKRLQVHGLDIDSIEIKGNLRRIREFIKFGRKLGGTHILKQLELNGFFNHIDFIVDSGYIPKSDELLPMLQKRAEKCKGTMLYFLLSTKLGKDVSIYIAKKFIFPSRCMSIWEDEVNRF